MIPTPKGAIEGRSHIMQETAHERYADTRPHSVALAALSPCCGARLEKLTRDVAYCDECRKDYYVTRYRGRWYAREVRAR